MRQEGGRAIRSEKKRVSLEERTGFIPGNGKGFQEESLQKKRGKRRNRQRGEKRKSDEHREREGEGGRKFIYENLEGEKEAKPPNCASE